MSLYGFGQAIPSHLKPISIERYGASSWSATALITTINNISTTEEDTSRARFFIKYAIGEHGKHQLEGESRSMKEISRTAPGFAPKAHSFGKLEEAPSDTYFFLCEFLNISNDLPDPKVLGPRLAQMHQDSRSPTGKFGFDVTTYDGKLPQITNWESSWASFFSNLLAGIARLDVEVNGSWDDLEEVLDQTFQRVIPVLLGNLTSDGRKIKPCLIHGDLWEGNIGTDCQTGQLYIFDAASYYAHNEMELAIWRTDHHRMNSKAYKTEYLKNFGPSEPIEEFDDRNRLHSVKTQLMYSAHVPGTKVRNAAFENLKYLVEKYGNLPVSS